MYAQGIISGKTTPFNIINAHIVVDTTESKLVQKAALFLQSDIQRITGKNIPIEYEVTNIQNNSIVIGTIGRSKYLLPFIRQKKVDATIKNKWEAYHIRGLHIESSKKNILVIAGSDRRGTAFGIFELSKQMGVSPWYWWADVAIPQQKNIFINTNVNFIDSPAVQYRGIFINDEAPALSNWSKEKFGGFNHLFYEKVFELVLRLKGNYLWPAMWGNAFNTDDTLNPIIADEYGIIMGTSHHEPMLRAQQEWKLFGKGQWNYTENNTELKAFWRKGIENMKNHESLITIGMRGDGDMPMTQGTAITLLEKIVADQRKIIETVTKKPAPQTPQLWALYKEVQDYYDKGMRVPDDVTLLLCDDNWGNLRRLPALTAPKRSGGYGIYYHFDYVGGPRNYKWINTNNLVRVWEQMHLAYEYNVKKIWIVNVGDIKPMEMPISFFLEYAWKPSAWKENNINQYYTRWNQQQFGKQLAERIGNISQRYAQLITIRKPELIDEHSFSPHHYNELNNIKQQWDELLQDANNISIPAENKDAYYQLILHPIKAMANLINMYAADAYNNIAAGNYQSNTNMLADRVKQYFINDSLISLEYHTVNHGKWNHMMSQTHIGYTYWQQPLYNHMPEVKYVPLDSIREPITFIKPKDISAEKMIPNNSQGNIFYELNGYVSMQAAHFTKITTAGNLQLKTLKRIGRDGDGITVFPVTATTKKLAANNISAEYSFYTYDSGAINIKLYYSPTLNLFHSKNGLQYSISIDNEIPQLCSLNKEDNNNKIWEEWVANNTIQKNTLHYLKTAGKHTLKIRFYHPAIVLQKIVIDAGGLKESYLGPAETRLQHQ